MKQECPLLFVWLTWLVLPVLALILGISHSWLTGGFVLMVGILAQIAYIHWFPIISPWIGYGTVQDIPPEETQSTHEKLTVTFYTANVCPFCPIVRERLNELKKTMAFELVEVDVTFRPQLLLRKGIKSVPVVEVGGRFLVGNATSSQLAAFLRECK
ncbi:MAG: hypothetical protein D6748_00940 [Calditrichaeota bacterium]|nr:MAG: hypothetical protein D6748_00940 [Calditrichota bacterium]